LKILLFSGGLICFLAVVAGALGSHALKAFLARSNGTANFELATAYMFYHGLGLIAAGLLKSRFPQMPFQYPGWLFLAGTVLFQGNLYLIALANIRTFQMLTPVGGICLMLGWLVLAIQALWIKGV
jgi:uncharacterized membrane protein YgdD (TMEM256/DUF423 family)